MPPSIRKAIIPAAGLGTRLLPLTAACAKELLPVGSIPMMEHCVREAAGAGIKEICVIINEKKRAIEEYFATKGNIFSQPGTSGKGPAFHFIHQPRPIGVADAIYLAKDFVRAEAFAVLMPDNIVASEKAAIGQLIEAFEGFRRDLLGLMRVKMADASFFGNVGRADLERLKGRIHQIKKLYPKGKGLYQPARSKGELRCFARYIMRPHFFDYIESEREEVRGEIDDVPPLQKMARDGHLFGCLVEGRVFDAGNPQGYAAANLYFMKRSLNAQCPPP